MSDNVVIHISAEYRRSCFRLPSLIFAVFVHVHRPHEDDAGIFDLHGHVVRNHFCSFSTRSSPVFGSTTSSAAVQPTIRFERSQLVVVFISANLGQIVSLRIEKQRIEQRLGAFHRRRLARTQLFVDFLQSFLVIVSRVSFQRLQKTVILAEKFDNLLIRYRNPNALSSVVTGCFLVRSTLTEMISLESVSYSSHAPLFGMMVVEYRLLFDLSCRNRIIRSRRSYKLSNHNSLRTVIYERALFRHQQESLP